MSDDASARTDTFDESVGSENSFEIAFVEARRNLEAQQASLESLRGRAGTLLSALALSTSFFGGLALGDRSIDAIGWMAFAAFVVAGSLIVAILWPWPGWSFLIGSRKLIEEYLAFDPPLPMSEVHRNLALQMDRWRIDNGRRLERLASLFRWASLALVVEIALWLIELGVA